MSRVATSVRLGFAEQSRRPLLLVLLVGTPFFFITRAIAQTEALPRAVTLPGGEQIVTTMRDVHGANMAVITVAFLAGLAGVFITHASGQADRRLVVAGYRPWQALTPRLVVLGALTALVVAVSVAVTFISFTPRLWVPFVAGTLAVGLVYGLLGALAGAWIGPLGATYLILFGSMLDLGIAQNPMFGSGAPPDWAVVLPGYGPGRLVVDAAFSPEFHAGTEAVIATGWVAGLGLVVSGLLLRRIGAAGNYGFLRIGAHRH